MCKSDFYDALLSSKILYISMTAMKRESTSGPKMNPSGPKKNIPPKREKSTNIGEILRPLPKKYAVRRLSVKKIINSPKITSPIAGIILPCKYKNNAAGKMANGVPSPGTAPIIPPMLPHKNALGIPKI